MNNSDPKKPINDYARYSSLAIQMGVIIAVFVFAGQWLDEKYTTETPWFTVFLSLAGVSISIYIAIKDLIKSK